MVSSVHDGPSPASSTSRAFGIVVHVLIALSIGLQALATTRLLCPPQSVAALRPLRVACPPCLWPFTDYPMYSEPHPKGDTLAWIEVHWEPPEVILEAPQGYGLTKAPHETWSAAFEREELRIRAELEREHALDRSATLVLKRFRVVLTERGFVPAGDDPAAEDGVESAR